MWGRLCSPCRAALVPAPWRWICFKMFVQVENLSMCTSQSETMWLLLWVKTRRPHEGLLLCEENGNLAATRETPQRGHGFWVRLNSQNNVIRLMFLELNSSGSSLTHNYTQGREWWCSGTNGGDAVTPAGRLDAQQHTKPGQGPEHSSRAAFSDVSLSSCSFDITTYSLGTGQTRQKAE